MSTVWHGTGDYTDEMIEVHINTSIYNIKITPRNIPNTIIIKIYKH